MAGVITGRRKTLNCRAEKRTLGAVVLGMVLQGLLSLALVLPVMAAEQSDDLPGIGRFPNARLEGRASREARNYPVLASRVSKIRGEIRADKEQWLDGWLERRIYEIPTGHSSDDAFAFISKEIQALGTEVSFTCEGRNCGLSNLWANDIFNVARLYGQDREQRYLLAHRSVEQGDEYYLLYTIARGTRRVYAMIDRFTVTPGKP